MALGITVWKGITNITPQAQHSALLRGGMGFNLAGLRGLGDVTYATDANGNVIYDSSGNPVAATDWASIGAAVTAGLAVLNSEQVTQLNIQRAQSGLAPITVAGTTSLLNTSTTTMMMMAGAALVLIMAMRR